MRYFWLFNLSALRNFGAVLYPSLPRLLSTAIHCSKVALASHFCFLDFSQLLVTPPRTECSLLTILLSSLFYWPADDRPRPSSFFSTIRHFFAHLNHSSNKANPFHRKSALLNFPILPCLRTVQEKPLIICL